MCTDKYLHRAMRTNISHAYLIDGDQSFLPFYSARQDHFNNTSTIWQSAGKNMSPCFFTDIAITQSDNNPEDVRKCM